MQKGIKYEHLTQKVYQSLLRAEGVDAEAKHDVVLTGKSGVTHQIDVFWSVNVGGVPTNVLISCKDWTSPVKKQHVVEWKGIVDDIPSASGVIVSRSGFQSGAETFAGHHGIQLLSVAEGEGIDWTGRVRKIYLTLTACRGELAGMTFWQSKDDAGDLDGELGSDAVQLVQGDEVVIGNFSEFLNQNLPVHGSEVGEFVESFDFPGAHLVIATSENAEPVAVDGFDVRYSVVHASREIVINGDEVVRAVLTNAVTDVVHHVLRHDD